MSAEAGRGRAGEPKAVRAARGSPGLGCVRLAAAAAGEDELEGEL